MTARKTAAPATNPPARLSREWPPFAQRLAAAIDSLEEDQFLILLVKRSNVFVQFFRHGAGGFRVETTSNAYRAGPEKLDARQASALQAMGWQPPTGTPKQSTPEQDPDGSPNYFIDFDDDSPRAGIADVAVRTFAEVLRVPYPSMLEYEAGDTDGGSIVLPSLKLRRAAKRDATARERSPEQVLLDTMRQVTGSSDLGFDDDGDIGIRFGDVVVFVRVTGEPAQVRIHSPLLLDVADADGLLARINEINRGIGHMHLFVDEDSVHAVSEIPANPLMVEHLAHALNSFCVIADGLDDLLRAEFGGRTLVPGTMPSSLKH